MFNGIGGSLPSLSKTPWTGGVRPAADDPPNATAEVPHLPVDSHEFKMLLDPSRFVDAEHGMEKLWKKFQGAAGDAGVEVKKARKDEVRTEDVSYLDTEDGQLREQGYILRYRDVKGGTSKDSLMLKYRGSDPGTVASAEVAVSADYEAKSKFELDRTFQDTEQSVYSKSTKVKMPHLADPTIGSMAEAFPTLETLGLPSNTELKTMHGGAIRQERHLLGDVHVGAGTGGTAPAYLTLWYEEDTPVVAEVSFATVNQGDPQVVENSESLMRHLHDDAPKWLSHGSTKTDFAYSPKTV